MKFVTALSWPSSGSSFIPDAMMMLFIDRHCSSSIPLSIFITTLNFSRDYCFVLKILFLTHFPVTYLWFYLQRNPSIRCYLQQVCFCYTYIHISLQYLRHRNFRHPRVRFLVLQYFTFYISVLDIDYPHLRVSWIVIRTKGGISIFMSRQMDFMING